MNKLILSLLFFAFSMSAFTQGNYTQNNVLKVALVAPIDVDAAFQNGQVKSQLPSQMRAGLDFIHGATLALDTIQTRGRKVDVTIVDTRDKTKNLRWAMAGGVLKQANLIITCVRQDEFKQLMNFAKENQIPLISATYPNSAGARDNPFLIITNSTLKANIQGVYSYIVQQYGTNPVFMIKPKNEDRVFNYFDEINKVNQYDLTNIKLLEIDHPDSAYLSRFIDTNKRTLIIGGTLDEDVALRIADAASSFKNVTIIGMPNWDTFRELYDKQRYTDVPILYPTPHYVSKGNPYYDYLANRYFTEYRIGPSDAAEKGFETTFKFVNILINYPNSFMEQINNKQYNSLHQFNIRPVYSAQDNKIDYYENKHISMVQILNGRISQAQ